MERNTSDLRPGLQDMLRTLDSSFKSESNFKMDEESKEAEIAPDTEDHKHMR